MTKQLRRFSAVATVACISLSACGETTVSGGIIGNIENKHMFQVTTQAGYLYRATFVTAALARIGEENIKNEGNAKQAISQMNGLSQSIGAMYALAVSRCGIPNAPTADNPASGLCVAGAYHTRFEEETPRLDGQIFNLAAVSLPEFQLKAIISQAETQQWVSLLWSVFQIAKEGLLSAHYALAVERERKQEWAYILAKSPGAPSFEWSGSFEDAVAKLPLLTQEPPHPDDFRTPMLALFKDMQQSCYNIQKTLDPNDWHNNNCPSTFLPVPDPAPSGFDGLKVSTDGKSNAQTFVFQCVSTDGLSIGQIQASQIPYQCNSDGSVATKNVAALTGGTIGAGDKPISNGQRNPPAKTASTAAAQHRPVAAVLSQLTGAAIEQH